MLVMACVTAPGLVRIVADRFLEEELARRYRDAAPATLALLQERCEVVAAELAAAESQLHAASDVPALRRAGNALSPTPIAAQQLPGHASYHKLTLLKPSESLVQL